MTQANLASHQRANPLCVPSEQPGAAFWTGTGTDRYATPRLAWSPRASHHNDLTCADTFRPGRPEAGGGRDRRNQLSLRPQADQVAELEVVTATGEILPCGPSSDAFARALAAQGQGGIITRAAIPLIPAPQRARWYRIAMPDVPSMTACQLRIARERVFPLATATVPYVTQAPAGLTTAAVGPIPALLYPLRRGHAPHPGW